MWLLFSLALAGELPVCPPGEAVHGITISTPTDGREWGSEEMVRTLDQLAAEGVNWIAYHPYARVHRDGSVSGGHLERPPDWLLRPIREAHARGLQVMVKPHLAHWGSGFSWRGDIHFEPSQEAHFFEDYGRWIVQLAALTAEADAFVVGTELDQTLHNEAAWRGLIQRVRQVHPGHLTYAANWDSYERVPFWDALDTIGIQAYFPVTPELAPGVLPTEAQLQAGWDRVLAPVHALSARTGKPVVFTELGYDTSPSALREPWASGKGGEALQERAYQVALARLKTDPAVRGAFLWKWFPGEVPRGDFRLTRPAVRQLIREAWATTE